MARAPLWTMGVPESLREAAARAVIEAGVSWLRSFDWDFFATCTWERPVGPTGALATVERWLKPLPGAYAAVGLQHGPNTAKIHVHALIGGTGRHPLRATLLRGSWIRSGHVQVEGYSPRRGGVEYLCAQATEVEIIGTMKPYRPRR